MIALRLPQNLHLPRGQPPVKGGPSTPPRIGGPVGTKKGRTRKGCSTAQRATKKVATVIAQRIPQNLHLPRGKPPGKGGPSTTPPNRGGGRNEKGENPKGLLNRTKGYQEGSHSDSAESSTESAPPPGETPG